MRFWLCCLLPWMAAVAMGQSAEPRAVEVVLPHIAAVRGSAWRIDDECFVALSCLPAWGWKATETSGEADVLAFNKRSKVAIKNVAGHSTIPLRAFLRSIGCGSDWSESGTSLDVWGGVGSISYREGKLRLSLNFPSIPRASLMQAPDRLIFDLAGVRLNRETQIDLGVSGRVAQYKPDVVRIVIDGAFDLEGIDRPTATGVLFDFDLKAAAKPHKASAPPVTPPVQSPPADPVVKTTQQRIDPPAQPTARITAKARDEIVPVFESSWPDPVANPVMALASPDPIPSVPLAPVGQVGAMAVESESANLATCSIPIGRTLSAPPQLKRVDLKSFALVFAGAEYTGQQSDSPSPNFASYSVVSDASGTTIRFELTRPMGVELSYSPTAAVIRLIKPEIGDGKLAGKTIVVDPGHGGEDTGAQNKADKTAEKDLTLAIGKLVADRLAKEGAAVILTRKEDAQVALKERSAIAIRNNADLFISVHINSNEVVNSRSGTMTFYHKGNAISKVLAECIQTELAKVNELPDLGVRSDGTIYQSGFSVLRNTTMPGVLMELGFINHKTDRARMKMAAFQKAVAEAVVRGVKLYYGDGKAKTNP